MSSSSSPNFFIIGAAKAATTSLASLVNQHPDAAIVRGKEPNFFSNDEFYRQGWEKYLALYSHCQGEKAIGDASTSYSRIRYHPEVITRIKKQVPEARIIYMVRNPLERIESAYVEHLAMGRALGSINDAVQKMPMMVDSSRYWEVFDAYRQHFDEEHIKVVWFEEYISNTSTVYAEVCRFLEISGGFEPDYSRATENDRENAKQRMRQSGADPKAIDTQWNPDVRNRVIESLRQDNLAFLDYFGKPRDYWGQIY